MTAAAHVLADLQARGLVQDCTDPDGLAARLGEGPLALYYGCDPTADSLHVGNLLGLLVLRRFQEAGHRPVALAGGATGMVGDPSGRSEERNLLDEDTLAANVAAIKAQIARVVDLDGPGGGLLVDNRDWTGEVRLLDFLRDVGKHVTVNTMLGRESVKNRLASEHGISFTEFSYMLLQAHDFLRLEEAHGVQLQIGGSDQWGNITAGVDLVRRRRGEAVHGLTAPLIVRSDGTKFGKSEGENIWLDAARTSPYRLYQYFLNVGDEDVEPLLLRLTTVAVEECRRIAVEHAAAPERRLGQRALARALTSVVHGFDAIAAIEEAAAVLFGDQPITSASVGA
ncbi:MAG: tyrosine--tRNA ligase, partial [Actinobacteria bacterium]|nr:tyrosine--tRNA ligase [Actinomycetota bacterium]